MTVPIPPSTEAFGTRLLDAAFDVHRKLGPGLLESVYEICLCHELSKAKVPHKGQVELPVKYDGIRIDAGLRLDVVVAQQVVAELKAVETLLPVHEAQLLTYLKLNGNGARFPDQV